MNHTAKCLALPAVSIFALAGTLLLAGWSSAPAASAHAAAKAQSQSPTVIVRQEVKASETYHNSLSPTQTAVTYMDASDPWAFGAPVNHAAILAGFQTEADESTPQLARGLTQVVNVLDSGGWPAPRYPSDVALNRSDPWQVVMTTTPSSSTALVLLEKVTARSAQYDLLHLIRTSAGGWRVAEMNALTTNRSQATALGASYINPPLQSWLSSEYVR